MVWQEVIEGSSVWVYEYVANGYPANAFAFLLDERDLAILSPPIGTSEADFAAIAAKGQVTALIAPTLDMIWVKQSGKPVIPMQPPMPPLLH